ncbi:hypothetical protein E4P36_33805 [Streptomyces sp. 4R-3d]|nr:hypothetical protein E4P36_33805 [Streptomyces sp. 4R-3d]
MVARAGARGPDLRTLTRSIRAWPGRPVGNTWVRRVTRAGHAPGVYGPGGPCGQQSGCGDPAEKNDSGGPARCGRGRGVGLCGGGAPGRFRGRARRGRGTRGSGAGRGGTADHTAAGARGPGGRVTAPAHARAARLHLSRARAAVNVLGDDGYGNGVRAAIGRLEHQLPDDA